MGEAYVKAVKDDVLEVWKTGALSAVGPLGDQVWVRTSTQIHSCLRV